MPDNQNKPHTVTALPRYATQPNPDAEGWDDLIQDKAESLSTPLMDWQSRGARLLGELSDDLCRCHEPARPLPRYKTVIVTVPRQQGKTALSRAALTTVAEREDHQEIFGTAQSRQYAARHVIKLGQALNRIGNNVKVLKGVGAEKVEWSNGTTYMPISPSEGGGHGDSIDFMLIDEGWKVEQETMGGVTPAMIAKPHSQMLVISTMGTLDSEIWNGMVARGRETVDEPGRTAYIEYSAPSDEAVFEDTCDKDGEPGCVWGEWMPALGVTVSHQDIRSAIEMMMSDPKQGRSEVVRAFGNRTVASLVTLFPADQVERAWRVIEPPTHAVVAVDVNESPPGATISLGYIGTWERDGEQIEGGVVWTLESDFGWKWVPARLEQILRTQGRTTEALVVDLGGPARALKAELESLAELNVVALVDRQPRDFAADCQRFYDGLREGTVSMSRLEALEDAVAGAVRKDLSDKGTWVVSRGRMTVDASPLIAAIIAHGVALELQVRPKTEFFAAWL